MANFCYREVQTHRIFDTDADTSPFFAQLLSRNFNCSVTFPLHKAIGMGRSLRSKGGRVDIHTAALWLIKGTFLGSAPSVAIAPPRTPEQARNGLFPVCAPAPIA